MRRYLIAAGWVVLGVAAACEDQEGTSEDRLATTQAAPAPRPQAAAPGGVSSPTVPATQDVSPPARPLTAADIVSDIEEASEADEADPVAAEGVLLPGKDALPIMKVGLVRHVIASRYLDNRDFVLDRVKATLSPTADVGQVNDALHATGARMCEISGPQIPFRVTLCIPLQPDRDGVQALADELKGFSAVVHAAPYRGVPANATRAHVE